MHHVDSDRILCVSRSDSSGKDVLLLVANLDPFNVSEAVTWLDLDALAALGASRGHPALDEGLLDL